MTIHRVIDSPFRDGGGNKPIWGTPLDLSHPWARGLVRYWHFSEGQGGRVADLVHGSNSGALNAVNTTWSGGPSLNFDGATAYADSLSDRGIPGIIPQVGQLQTANDASSVSVMCWFKPNGASQSAHLMSRWDDAVASNGGKVWSLLLGDATGTAAGNRVWFGYQSSDVLGSVPRTITTNGFNNLAWNYAGASFTNTMTTSQMNIVLNGVTTGFTGNIWFANSNTTTPGLVVGADHNGGVHGGFFNGQILVAAIWHRWLDLDELIGLRNRPWEIFLESNVRRFFRTTTPTKGVPIIPELKAPVDVNSNRAATFSEKVAAIINSLLRQGQLYQSGINDWSINAAAIMSTAGVTSFNTRTGAVTLQASDLPIFSAAAPGAVPASGGGTANFLRADGIWVAPAATYVTSVSNSDGTLAISPTTGAVIASLNLSHVNTWLAGPQTFKPGADGTIAVVVQANSASQTADLQDWQVTAAHPRARITAAAEFSNPKPNDCSGTLNEVFGVGAGAALTTAGNETLVGYQAGNALTTGNNNTALGTQALAKSTIGIQNTALGFQAMGNAIVTGANNVAIGGTSLQNVTSGGSNMAIGQASLGLLTTGNANVGVGGGTLGAITTTTNNVAIGTFAMTNATSGGSNTAIGQNALGGTFTGADLNIAIGNNTGAGTLANGARNLLIGNNADVATSALNDCMAIGNGAVGQNEGLALGHNAICSANEVGWGPNFTAETFYALSSTSTKRQQAKFKNTWADNTDATRKGRLTISAVDATADREVLKVETSGTAGLFGAFGVTAVGQQSGDVSAALVALGWMSSGTYTRGRFRVLSDQTNATAVLQNLADLTVTLTAGASYFGRIALRALNTVSTDGIQFDFNGGTATMTNFWAGSATVITTTLAGVIANATSVERILLFDISLTVNAGGTFIPRFAANTPTTGTATVRLGSFLTLEDSAN